MLTVEAAFQLAAEHQNAGRLAEAEALYEQILRVAPGHLQSLNNLGLALAERGDFEEAATAYRQALALRPDYTEAKFNYSLLLLLLGDFEHGWPLYESRWDQPGMHRRHLAQPLWDGGDLAGKRILLHKEQGFGDAIQFIRYAPLIAERGGHVIIECPRTLVDVFCSVKGVRKIVAAGDPLPPFDLHTPMHSLPWLFRTTVESIPAETPYLFAEPNRRHAWEILLGAERRHLRVGVALPGSPHPRWPRKRDIPRELFWPILRTAGVQFFSLQAGPTAGHLLPATHPPSGGDSIEALQDFADTAALLANLDLIITADTAMAHLAGALGRPTWTLVPFVPAWRWGLGRNDSPWYPTMRLFRQPALGDWESVIHRVAHELERAVKTRAV